MTAPAPAGARGDATPRGDGVVMAALVVVYGFSLGQAWLVVPLVALAAGYDAAAVGLLASVSAISQVGMRLTLPRLLARFPDRTMMALAAVTLAAAYLVILASDALPALLAAQLLLGTSRAYFWTSSQTHAVRSSAGSFKGMARITTWSNVGTMLGPAAAGVIATAGLTAPAVAGLAGALGALGLTRGLLVLPTYDRPPGRGTSGMWRRPGVDLACWSNVSTGGWRALLQSFVPVVLEGAGHGPAVIGAIMASADAVGTAGTAYVARHTIRRVRRTIGVAVALTAASMAVFPFVAGSALAAAVAIGVSGLAVGFQQTLGPALASEAVAGGEQGEAIAVVGTFRAAALLVTPAAVSGALGVLALPVALAGAAVAIALPTGVVLARGRRGGAPTTAA